MDAKKPLIIVPPLSEPMTKLKEVLEGIAAEENIEIYTVEDAKEFGQLIGSGGQALVMISSAKICATLLQENRNLIHKNHTKVILLTPKEIPVKTLEKFRKIGLTEAIVESIAPKTLLYKVKLQLKSIKLVQKEENTQNLVKSMIDSTPRTKVADDLVMDSSEKTNTENPEEAASENKRKMVAVDDGESLDYLSNLAGKKTQAEDVIETHWKSKREKSNLDLENSDEGNLKTKSDNQSLADIDMYYRGKQKANELEVESSEDLYKKKTIVEDEVADYDLKKKTSIEEELEPAEKRKKVALEESSEDLYERSTKAELAEEQEVEKKKKIIDEEDEFDLEALQRKLLEQIEDEKEDEDLEKKEDLGGYYKGKITKQDTLETEEDEITQEKTIAEEILAEKNKHTHDLEEETEDEKKKRAVEDVGEENNSHDGEVDNIDNFMRGDLESTEAIKTRMESEGNSDKNNLEDDLSEEEKRKKKEILDEEEKDFHDKKEKLETIDGDDKDLKKEKLVTDEAGSDFKREALSLAEEESELQKRETERSTKASDDSERDAATKLLEDSELNDARSGKRDEEEDLKRRDINNSKLDIDKDKSRDTHEGKTDKISTYYRSGEGKDKDQDWDLKNEKKSTELNIEKVKKADIDLGRLKKTQQGEEVIDYRKLKEEFDMIARGEIGPDGNIINGPSGSAPGARNIEDSFKVVEIGPTPFDFAVEIITELYAPNITSKDIFKMVSEKLLNDEKGHLVANVYTLKDKKFKEVFNSYTEFSNLITDEVRFEWNDIKEDESNKELFNSFSMPTWMCRSIPDKDTFWRDIELPTWANQELTNKKVELVYPFFDGVDRMGYVHIYFPNGINPANDRKIQITIEMLRSVFLETIQRSTVTTEKVEEESVNEEKKNNVLGFLGGMFGKKKAS